MKEYSRTATCEELVALPKAEAEVLKMKLKECAIHCDPDTFVPFAVLDGVRYDIEPIVDKTLLG